MGQTKWNIKIVQAADGTKDAQVTVADHNECMALSVLVDAASLRILAANMVQVANKMDSVIVVPNVREACPACEGHAGPFYRHTVTIDGRVVHMSTHSDALHTPCRLVQSSPPPDGVE